MRGAPRATTLPGISIAGTSARPHQSGIPSCSQIAWLEPWWSGWT